MTALIDQTLASLACSIPGATRLFRQYKLDFCSGGHNSLRDAAGYRDLDPELIASQLADLGDRTGGDLDWRSEPAARLIEHVLIVPIKGHLLQQRSI